jgi:hypothetical protein
MDAARVHDGVEIDGAEQGLAAQEPDAGGDFKERKEAGVGALLVANAGADPDVRRGVSIEPLAGELIDAVVKLAYNLVEAVAPDPRAFGEKLPVEGFVVSDYAEEIGEPFDRDLVVKPIGEAGAEYAVADAGGEGFGVPFVGELPVAEAGAPAGFAFTPAFWCPFTSEIVALGVAVAAEGVDFCAADAASLDLMAAGLAARTMRSAALRQLISLIH